MATTSKTLSIIFFTIMVCLVIMFCVLPFNCALGYKKFMKGLLLGALLAKHKGHDEQHYFYPVYHGMPVYDDYGHY